MRAEKLRFALIVSALSIGALMVAPMTAEAAKKKGSNREAVIGDCLAKAGAAAPGVITPGDAGRAQRVAVYKDCMTQAGQRP